MTLTLEQLPHAVSQLFGKLENIEMLLSNAKESQTDDVDSFLNIKEAAELLNLSVPTIYGYVHRAAIPVCKKGNRLYFSKQDLHSWLKSGRKKTVDEVNDVAKLYIKNRKGGVK